MRGTARCLLLGLVLQQLLTDTTSTTSPTDTPTQGPTDAPTDAPTPAPTLDCGLHGNFNGTECECADHWSGAQCDTCGPQWMGLQCEHPYTGCLGTNDTQGICTGHGHCDRDTDLCVCVDRWAGHNCSSCERDWTGSDCGKHACSTHGVLEDDGSCVCDAEWMGETCEAAYHNCTHLDNCSGHGACNRTDDTCSCVGVYTGLRCELKEDTLLPDDGTKEIHGTKLIGVGLYIMNLAEDSLAMGTFYADFLLFKFEDPRPLPKDFDIRNQSQTCDPDFPTSHPDTSEPFLVNAGQFSSLKLIQPHNSTNNASYHRVQSKFYRRIDVSQWPLTVPGYEITLRDAARTQGQLVFCHLDRFTDFSPTLRFPGRRDSLHITFAVDRHCVPGMKGVRPDQECAKYPEESFSQFSLYIEYDHGIWYGLRKFLLPAFLIVLVVACSFVLPLTDVAARQAVYSSMVVAAVMHHMSLSNSVPYTGQISNGDAVMFLVYLFIFAAVALNVVLPFVKEHNEVLAGWCKRTITKVLFATFPVLLMGAYLDFPSWWLMIQISTLTVAAALSLCQYKWLFGETELKRQGMEMKEVPPGHQLLRDGSSSSVDDEDNRLI